jgi:hypothetical protein
MLWLLLLAGDSRRTGRKDSIRNAAFRHKQVINEQPPRPLAEISVRKSDLKRKEKFDSEAYFLKFKRSERWSDMRLLGDRARPRAGVRSAGTAT